MGSTCMVIITHEAGQPIDTVRAASRRTGSIEIAQPHVRLHVLQICRFLASVLSAIGYKAQAAGLETIPYLNEFFAIFNN